MLKEYAPMDEHLPVDEKDQEPVTLGAIVFYTIMVATGLIFGGTVTWMVIRELFGRWQSEIGHGFGQCAAGGSARTLGIRRIAWIDPVK